MKKAFASILTLCLLLALVPAAVTAAEPMTMDQFVTAVENANYNYDGQGVTVAIAPVSGCFRTGHSCGHAAATHNTPNRVNGNNAQFHMFAGDHNVTIKNVNFTFTSADFTICVVSGWAGTFTASDVKNAQLFLNNTGNVTFSGCTFDNVILTTWDCTGIATVTGCSFENIVDTYAIKDIRGSAITVENNSFTDCNAGVMLSAAAADTSVGDISISGNTFTNVSRNGDRGLVQFAAAGNYTGAIALENNTATNCGPVIRQLNESVKSVEVTTGGSNFDENNLYTSDTNTDNKPTLSDRITTSTGSTAVYGGPVMNGNKVTATANGYVKTSPIAASEGATITIYTFANEGYEMSSVTVTDKNGEALELTLNSAGRYTYKIPAGGVTVTPVFSAK